MRSRSESAILQLLHTPKIGARTLQKILEIARREDVPVEDLIADSGESLGQFGIKSLNATSLETGRNLADQVENELAEGSIEMLVNGEAGYPNSLTRREVAGVAPVLFAAGNTLIARQPGVAFCGSRDASANGLKIACQCAELLSSKNVSIVSGYAQGVDLAAHGAALKSGGFTTIVLPEGILRFRVKREIVEDFDWARTLVLSQFPPRMSWTAGNAMQRNAVILGLAEVVVVIEAGTTGGTFAAGEAALKQSQSLFVVDFTNPPESAAGNRILLDRGATPLRMRHDGQPNLAEVERLLAERGKAMPATSSIARQPTLFDHVVEAS